MVSLSSIFLHCSCVVFHGGAGTCAQVLLAGVPSIVIPILPWFDQRGWGYQIQKNGIQATRFNDYLRHALTTDIHLNQQSPFHYFIHLLAPHPPFVIDRYGETTDKWIDQFGTLADASSVTCATLCSYQPVISFHHRRHPHIQKWGAAQSVTLTDFPFVM